VEIREADPGASVLVDGRPRGTTPLAAPLRVSAGTRVVRVVKEGYLPIEERVDVAAKQTAIVRAKLLALVASGRLRVTEASQRSLDVLVDGAIVGKTPYEGNFDLGAHVIVLRGEGNLGTQPVAATLQKGQIASLTLAAEELGAIARIEPTPAGASVAID